VNYCDCGVARWWGQQEFAIPQNVLEIVYGQTICWIGTFYSPLLPAICTIKYFFIFYIKKVCSISNATRIKISDVVEVCDVPPALWFLGLADSQLPSGRAAVPSVQLQLLLPGRAADRPRAGLPARVFQRGSVSNACCVCPSAHWSPLDLCC